MIKFKLLYLMGAMCFYAQAFSEDLPALSGKPGPGIYVLTNTSNWVTVNGERIDLFTMPVDGVVNYVNWRNVQPEENSFDYPGLDRMTAEAAAAGKTLSYGILAGIHTPDWVYETYGIEKFCFDHASNRTSYLPWKVENGVKVLNRDFLEIWEKTVAAFARRLYADPQRDLFHYIPVTGFPFGNGLELYLPLKAEEYRALHYDQQAEKIYIEFCCRVVDIFLRHFPDFPLGIAFTDWFGADGQGQIRRTRESEAILRYAVNAGKKRGVTVVPMGLWLGWRGVCDTTTHPLMRTYRKYTVMAGYGAWEGQMGTCEKNCIPIGEQIDFARKNKVTWIQFWHHDLVCPTCREELEKRKVLQ